MLASADIAVNYRLPSQGHFAMRNTIRRNPQLEHTALCSQFPLVGYGLLTSLQSTASELAFCIAERGHQAAWGL
jgi:hypothetical protein